MNTISYFVQIIFNINFIVCYKKVTFEYHTQQTTAVTTSNYKRQLNSNAMYCQKDDFMVSPETCQTSDYKARFSNIARLYEGDASLQRLWSSNCCVIGLGGVGSWVCEALARSGVRKLTLVDLDDICISNINRQIHALSSTVGQFKADALRNRILDINPHANVRVIYNFITPENIDEVFADQKSSGGTKCRFDCIIDAADRVSDKAAIVDFCVRTNTMCVVSGGAGGLTDPTLLRVTDLSRALGDSLIMRVRKKLRQDYLYPSGENVNNGCNGNKKGKSGKTWRIAAVHTLPTGLSRSPANVHKSAVCNATADDDDNTNTREETSSIFKTEPNEQQFQDDQIEKKTISSFRACDYNFGNACFSTGTQGLIMASVAVSAIATGTLVSPRSSLLLNSKSSNHSCSTDKFD